MGEVLQRPMTEAERAELLQALKPVRESMAGCETVSLFVVIVLITLVVTVFTMGFTNRPEIYLSVGAATAAILVAVFCLCFGPWIRSLRSSYSAHAASVREDIEKGNVKIKVFRPVAAWLIEDIDDEGPGYLLQLPKNRILFLQGQHLYWTEGSEESEIFGHDGPADRSTSREFPNTEFGIVSGPSSGWFLGLACLGDPLPISRRIDPDEELKSVERYVGDGDVFPGRLETVLADAKNWAESRSKGK